MSAIFDHLTAVARSNDLEALILWSDLLQFYQKLGFSSIGRESRFVLGRCDRGGTSPVSKIAAQDLSDADLHRMLQLRPKVEWELERSLTEFRALLAIPNTALFVRRKGLAVVSWFAIGKGSDMQGIVHEWGASAPQELIQDIQTVLELWNLTSLTVLSPVTIARSWIETFRLHAISQTEHSMALGLPIGNKGQEALSAIARSFLWGFDSI